jgi:hypothetical protein
MSRAGVMAGLVLALSVNVSRATCVGDCGGDTIVTVDELVIMGNIALGHQAPSACPPGRQRRHLGQRCVAEQ